jgi:hypothetical protein
MRCRSWFRNWATNRKVSGSVPHGVIVSFHWLGLSDRTMGLVSAQSLTEISTRSISLGGGDLPSWCAHLFQIWEPQPPESLRACPCLYRVCFTFLCMYCTYNRCTHREVYIPMRCVDVFRRNLVRLSSGSPQAFSLAQCFSSAGPRPGTGPWHKLYRAATDSPGIDN